MRVASRRSNRTRAVAVVAALVVGGGVAATQPFGSPLGAQIADTATPISTLTPAARNAAPAVSSDGAIVAYEVTSDSVERVDIVDRAAASTTAVPTADARRPAVSGDGCTVAYLAPEPFEPAGEPGAADADLGVALWAFDRCNATTVQVAAYPSVSMAAAGPPALSSDGAVMAWSTGTEIVAFDRSGAGYVERVVFDSASPAAGDVTGAVVDVAADGSAVAFTAGPGTAFVPNPANVFVADLDIVPAADPDAGAGGADEQDGEQDAEQDGEQNAEQDAEQASEQDSDEGGEQAGDGVAQPDGQAGEQADGAADDGPDPAADADAPEAAPAPQGAVALQAAPRVAVSRVSATLDGAPSGGLSWSPSLGADGTVVVFASSAADLDVVAGRAPEELGASYVALVERGVRSDLLVADGDAPHLSDDGRHVAYDGSDAVELVTWVDDGSAAADRAFGRKVSNVVNPAREAPEFGGGVSVSGPTVVDRGRFVVFDSDDGKDLVSIELFHSTTNVYAVERAPRLDSARLELDDAAPGTVLNGELVFLNVGTSGVQVADVDASAGISIESTTCSGVLEAGDTCRVVVSVQMPTAGFVDGSVVVSTAGWSPVSFAASVTAGDAPTATVVPTTLAPATRDTPPTTAPASTATTTPTATTAPRPTTRPTSGTGTTVPATAQVNAQPAVLDFAPTIVRAGVRSEGVLITNGSSSAVSIGAVSASGAGDFLVAADDCSGVSLAAGASCIVVVDFAPGAEGPLAATLDVPMADRTLVVPLSGVGASAPILEVVPPVVAGGQVVSVFGAGFPAGLPVVLEVDAGVVQRTPLTVDADGRLVASIVMLPNTPTGPVTIRVAGQPNSFADTEADVLVADDGNSSSAATFGRLGPSVGR